MTVAAGPVGTWSEADSEPGRAVTRSIVGTLLVLSMLPIGIYGFPIVFALADITVPLLIGYMLGRKHSSPLLGVFVALCLGALLVILSWGLFDPNLTVTSAAASAAFFLKPWIAYFAAYRLVRSSDEPARSARTLLMWAACWQVLLLAYLIFQWVSAGTLTREFETGLGLSVRGFSGRPYGTFGLYGYGQVNSTAALLVVAPALFLFAFSASRHALRFLWLTLIPVVLYVVVASGSRGAVFGSFLFVVLAVLTRPANPRAALVARLLVVAAIVGVLAYQGANLLALSPKYAATLEQLSQGQTGAATSGRTDILAVMLQDIARSPFVGTGFGDFRRFHTAGDLDWIDSSPHNAWVGPLHKGGLILGGTYLAMMLRAAPRRSVGSLPAVKWLGTPLMAAVGLGVMPALDALTTPVVAALLLIVAGSVRALGDSERETSLTDGQSDP